jgi:hypothetical protein
MNGHLRVSWALLLQPLNDAPDLPRSCFQRLARTLPWRLEQTPMFIQRVYGLLAKIPWDLMMPIALIGHYVMESQMLRGLKWRAEERARTPGVGRLG